MNKKILSFGVAAHFYNLTIVIRDTITHSYNNNKVI